MAVVPRYWYVETFAPRRAFKVLPADMLRLGPKPDTETCVISDPSTGEIHGEAVLMSALPWPRFRAFSTGQQVVLPHWMAEALERADDELRRTDMCADGEYLCANCVHHGKRGLHHYRVECSQGKVFSTIYCHCQFPLFKKTQGHPGPAHPGLPHRRGVGGSRQGGRSPEGLPLDGGAKPTNAYKKARSAST